MKRHFLKFPEHKAHGRLWMGRRGIAAVMAFCLAFTFPMAARAEEEPALNLETRAAQSDDGKIADITSSFGGAANVDVTFDGETALVTLKRDMVQNTLIQPTAPAYIIDLNGHNITGSGQFSYTISLGNEHVTIKGQGVIQGVNDSTIHVDDGGTLRLEGGVTVKGLDGTNGQNGIPAVQVDSGAVIVDGATVLGGSALGTGDGANAVLLQLGGDFSMESGLAKGGSANSGKGASAVLLGQTDHSARTCVISGGELQGGSSVSGMGGYALYNETDGSSFTIEGDAQLTGGESQSGQGGCGLFNVGNTDFEMTGGKVAGGNGNVGQAGFYFSSDDGGTLKMTGGEVTGGHSSNEEKFGGVGIRMGGNSLTISGSSVVLGGDAPNGGGDAVTLLNSANAVIRGGKLVGGTGSMFGGCGIYTNTNGTVAISSGLLMGGLGEYVSSENIAGFGFARAKANSVSISGGAFASQATNEPCAMITSLSAPLSGLLEPSYSLWISPDTTVQSDVTSTAGVAYAVASKEDTLILPTIVNPLQLYLTLNFLTPDSATLNADTVTQDKDVISSATLFFNGGFDGVWDMGSKHLQSEQDDSIIYLQEQACLSILNGQIVGNDALTSVGNLRLQNIQITSQSFGISLWDGSAELTGVEVSILKSDQQINLTSALAILSTPKVTITSGSFSNANAEEMDFAFLSDGKTLASCIPSGSASVPADSVQDSQLQTVKERFTVSIMPSDSGDPPVSVPPVSPSQKPSKEPPVKGETILQGNVDETGTAKVTVSPQNIADAIENAKKDAAEGRPVAVSVKVETSQTAARLAATLPKTVQESLIRAKVDSITLASATATLSFSLDAIKQMNTKAKADITITIEKADRNHLTGDAKALVGERPLLAFHASYKDGEILTNFGENAVTISIPYSPDKEDSTGSLQAVYVDEEGKAAPILQSGYDANRKALIFTTSHFSRYGVGCKEASQTSDILGHWAEEDILFTMSRGLLSSTNGAFSPNEAMTTGMVTAALTALSGKNMKAIGSGDTDTVVTREDFAAMLQSFGKAVRFSLPAIQEASPFADEAAITASKAEAVDALRTAGILMGKSGNRFDPQSPVTRAEAAGAIRRLVMVMIDPASGEGFRTNDSGVRMYYQNGKPLTGTQTISGKSYTFDANGELLPEEAAPEEPAPNPEPPTAEKTYILYTVKKNDWLSKIAKTYQCTVGELAKLNQIANPDLIYQGQVIKIPR